VTGDEQSAHHLLNVIPNPPHVIERLAERIIHDPFVVLAYAMQAA
jgi:hypothetical protein